VIDDVIVLVAVEERLDVAVDDIVVVWVVEGDVTSHSRKVPAMC